MSVSRVRGFLIQVPKPTSVRVTGDGEPQIIKPGKSYAKCAESILALGGDLVEALDSEGNVLRATRLGIVDAQRSEAAPVPDALKEDPQALLMTHFANLIHRAYEHSSEVAFSKLGELVEKLGDRSEAIEARLERTEAQNRRLYQEQVEDAFDRARELAEQRPEQGGGLVEQMAGAFLSGQLGGGLSGAKRPNGKG